MYQRDLKSCFPPDLAALCRQVARRTGVDLEPEAAIVNYYPLGSSMGGHLDDAEHTLEKPIVSISIGCAAIFLIGGRDKTVRPTPILLRSGDAIVMSGESRYCYHGVPFILPRDFPLVDCAADAVSSSGSDEPPAAEGSAQAERVREFLRVGRININVRQVRKEAGSGHGYDVWVDKAGTGATTSAVAAVAASADASAT